jgi:ribosomal protein L3 glutamine methyltransferase
MAELIQHQFSPWIIADQVDNILDLCTGSACIAIACCFAFPEAAVDAVDICADALEVAEINREHYHLEEQLTLIKSDCFSAVSDLKYDLIVSNPPYVGFDEMQSLPKEYAHEPTLALEAENNGLALVERILHEAHNHLSDIGILVVEVGNSDEALVEAYPDLPFTWLEFENGGHGVFLLTYQQLHTYFAS